MPPPSPILVFGSAQRSGTTLVQRLLVSHPDVMVWGEHGGHLAALLEASRNLQEFNEAKSGRARGEFEQRGHDGWIANLMPEPAVVADAARGYMEALFAAPAKAAGRSRWGFKEVRFGLREAEAIRELFPSTRVIHLTRDPRDQLRSIDHWERTIEGWFPEITALSATQWVEINASFLGARDEDWVMSWRHEDITADPDRFVAAAAELIEIDAGELDRTVFDRNVSDYPGAQREHRSFADLPRRTRKLIDRRMREVAKAYGYDL